MTMIKFDMKYLDELERHTAKAVEDIEIVYRIEDQALLKMKNGYREMAAFNQDYSEIGFNEDMKNLLRYENFVLDGASHED